MTNEATTTVHDIGVIEPGLRTPEFTIPLTIQRMVMEAAANRDFASIHHDTAVAQASGAPDMFVNTMFLQTLFEVSLRNWMGPAGRLRRLGFQMRTFNCPGDILRCAGEVTAIRQEDVRQVVDLDVWIESQKGRTVVGTATVDVPAAG